MNRFTNKILMLSAIFAAFAIAPMASYGQGKVEEAKNVNVVNTVRILSARDLNPFQATQSSSTDLFLTKADFIVPAGKRLIIEFASVKASMGKDERLSVSIFATNGGTETSHQIVMNFQQGAGTKDFFAGAEQLLMYADPGTTVRIEANRLSIIGGGNAQSMTIDASITGYLVDLQ